MSAIAPELIASDWPEHVVLEGVSWETYERLREETDQSIRHFYMTYDEGTLEIMSPNMPHEFGKKVLAGFIEILTEELNIASAAAGNVTIRRKRLKKGLEPDECYYI